MPTVAIYNHEGAKTGELELDPGVFAVQPKEAVLHEVVVAHQANARQAIAHTKTRGEVRGGGKKPWAQKHTGRARHGSIRSPIWVGGGTTFGPRSNRNFALKVNAKTRKNALRMALTDKVASNCFIVVEDFAPAEGKTKAAKATLDANRAHAATTRRAPSVLLVLPSDRRDAARSIGNLSRVTGVDAAHLNAFDVIRHDVMIATRAAVERTTAQCKKRTPATHGQR